MQSLSARRLRVVLFQTLSGHACTWPWTAPRWCATARLATSTQEDTMPRWIFYIGLLALVWLCGLPGGLRPAAAGLTVRVSARSTGDPGNSYSS